MPDTFVPAPVPPFPEADVDCENCDDCDFDTYEPAVLKTIDFDVDLYGNVKPFEAHLCVSTGKSDWRHTIEEETGSGAARVQAAIEQHLDDLEGRHRLVVTNTSEEPEDSSAVADLSDVTILSGSWSRFRGVRADQMSELVKRFVIGDETGSVPQTLTPEVLPHRAYVLICSHNRRDARCGKTAPLLRDAFEQVLRERELFYDPDEGTTEGMVRVEYCSHIGGHKFAGNVLVYRRYEHSGVHKVESVWYGRVMPKHAPLIVDHTIIKGEVLRPLVRGGMRW